MASTRASKAESTTASDDGHEPDATMTTLSLPSSNMANTRASTAEPTTASDDGHESGATTTALSPPSRRIRITKHLRAISRRKEVFRFFDLPAEMRNIVYRELLLLETQPRSDHSGREELGSNHFGRKESICYPAILATCRQAYKEANSILYDENTFTIDLGAVRWYYEHLAVNGREVAFHPCEPEEPETEWPSCLLRAKDINLNIFIKDLDAQNPSELILWRRLGRLNQALYELAYLLEDNEVLGTVHVCLESDYTLETNQLQKLFFPLASVNAEFVFKFDGITAAQSQKMERLLVTTSKPRPKTEIVRRFQRALKRGGEAMTREKWQSWDEGKHQDGPVTRLVGRGMTALSGNDSVGPRKDLVLEEVVAALEQLLRQYARQH